MLEHEVIDGREKLKSYYDEILKEKDENLRYFERKVDEAEMDYHKAMTNNDN